MKRFSVALVSVGFGLLVMTSSCHKEGPAEKAGKDIDKATENAGDAMKNAGKSMGQKMEDAGDKMKDAARR
jgi:hypothetical protein